MDEGSVVLFVFLDGDEMGHVATSYKRQTSFFPTKRKQILDPFFLGNMK